MLLPDLEKDKKKFNFVSVALGVIQWILIIGFLSVFYLADKELSFEVNDTAKLAFRWMVAVIVLYLVSLNIMKWLAGKDGETMTTFLRRGVSYDAGLYGLIMFSTVVSFMAFGLAFIIFMVHI